MRSPVLYEFCNVINSIRGGNSMSVYRIQLKSSTIGGSTYSAKLKFCKEKGIIGVGWPSVDCTTTENIDEVCHKEYDKEDRKSEGTAALKALNCLKKMKSGDLIWTRSGDVSTEYYLCKVTSTCKYSDAPDNQKHDITNYVECEWASIGNMEQVPGNVIKSLNISATAQSVSGEGVEKISKLIWNRTVDSNKYDDVLNLTKEDFWSIISPEDLECLVLLYLQMEKGYKIYSSTLKRTTKLYECVMVSDDGSHKCYPQVKAAHIVMSDYGKDISSSDIVYLFSSTDDYGGTQPSNVKIIKKDELYNFAMLHRKIMPTPVIAILEKIV